MGLSLGSMIALVITYLIASITDSVSGGNPDLVRGLKVFSLIIGLYFLLNNILSLIKLGFNLEPVPQEFATEQFIRNVSIGFIALIVGGIAMGLSNSYEEMIVIYCVIALICFHIFPFFVAAFT